jgi:hypothetical protein
MMFVTLVAILCHVSPARSGACVEEIVTDSSKGDISFQSCMIQGQIGVAKCDVRTSDLPQLQMRRAEVGLANFQY